MRITTEIHRAMDSKNLSPQVRVLLFKIIEASYPNHMFTEYDELEDGVMNAYDSGFSDGETSKANELYKLVELILK